MHQPSRARRILKWTGAAFCAAILATLCATISHDIYFRVPGIGLLFVGEGYFGVFGTNTQQLWNRTYENPWTIEPASEEGIIVWELWPFDPEDGWQASAVLGDLASRSMIVFLDGGGVAIPGSLAFSIVLLPTSLLFYWDRRRRFICGPPSRFERGIKWSGAGLAALILVNWLISLWYASGVILPGRTYIGTHNAMIIAIREDDDSRPDTSLENHFLGPQFAGFGLVWLHYEYYSNNHGEAGYIAEIPFWLLLCIVATPTAWLWHRDRRRIPAGHCLRCGYDLTGNTSGVCSECGEKLPTTAVGTPTRE